MYIKFDKKRFLNHFAVVVFLWYGFTIGWQGKIWQGGSFYLNRILYVASIIVCIVAWKNKKNLLGGILPFLMVLIVCFFNNGNIAHKSNTIMVWSLCAIILFYYLSSNTCEWHVFLIKVLAIIGLLYAWTVIQCLITPSFFTKVCLPFFQHYGYANDMNNLYQGGYITGFSPHYSITAIYLAVTFGAAIAYGFASKFTSKKYSIIAIVIFASILLTGKRAPSMFIVATTFILYLLVHCDEPIKRWEKIILIALSGVLVLLLAAQFIPHLLNVVNRFIETEESGDIEMGRGITRALALQLWLENPLFGIGWDAFKYYYREFNGVFLNVHCVYVQLLCEVGVVGALPFYLFFVISIVKAVLLLRRMTLDHEENFSKHLVLIYSVYIQIFFLLYCLTGNPLYDNPTIFTYLMGCSMGEYYWLKRKEERLN